MLAWPDRERRERAIGAGQPTGDRAPIRREGRPQDRPMGLEASPVRAALARDHPDRHRCRLPAEVGHDLRPESPLSIDDADQFVDVGDRGLQLDDAQGATPRMPGNQVDHSPLPVDREGQLGPEHPHGPSPDRPSHRLVKRRMGGVQQAVEIAGPPAGEKLKADVEGGAHLTQGVERERAEVTALDPRDGRLRHPGQPREIRLPKLPPAAHGPDGAADSLVVHSARLTPRDQWPRIASRAFSTPVLSSAPRTAVDSRWIRGAEPARRPWTMAHTTWTTRRVLWTRPQSTSSDAI